MGNCSIEAIDVDRKDYMNYLFEIRTVGADYLVIAESNTEALKMVNVKANSIKVVNRRKLVKGIVNATLYENNTDIVDNFRSMRRV